MGPRSQWANVFFARTHFLECEDVAGGSQQSGGKRFLPNTVARPVGPSCQGEETFFQLNKEELSLHATMDLVGPSRQALHVQSSSDDSCLLTTPHRTQ